MDFFIIKKDKISSTNSELKLNAEKYENHTVLCAKEQTDGRGRTGRSFYSPPTGLYFSVLFKDIEQNPTDLTVIAAVAVMKGIYDTFGIKTQVKWVNDIIHDGRKVCGILAEGVFGAGKLRHAVVGIGINLATEKFPDEIKNIAGGLHESTEKSDELLKNILRNLGSEIEKSASKNYLEFYRKNCLTLGRKVRLVSAEKDEEVLALDIGENAELIVENRQGGTEKIFYGEAKIINGR